MSKEPRLNPRMENGETLFAVLGGSAACEKLSAAFHQRVSEDAELRRLFPKNFETVTDRFALFMGERLGGPASYTAKRGKNSLVCRHAHLSISSELANAWLAHMARSLDELGIVGDACLRLKTYFAETALTLCDPLLSYYALPLDELRTRLELEPELARETEMGHSLLGEAAGRWDVPRVRFLLQFGADISAKTALGHGALYIAANAVFPGREADGNAVVEILINYGAEVNERSGHGKCSPLHMAARRGTVPIAEALIAAGADIFLPDAKGQTALQRAVNCRQRRFVAFLVGKGAR